MPTKEKKLATKLFGFGNLNVITDQLPVNETEFKCFFGLNFNPQLSNV